MLRSPWSLATWGSLMQWHNRAARTAQMPQGDARPRPPRPHRGISQDHLPLYLGCFEFVHNVRRRGSALLGSLLGLSLT
jgi:transposase-like protein